MDSLLSFWSHWGDELANLAIVAGMFATATAAVIAAMALRRSRELQSERNTFEFILSFAKDANFKEGAILLKGMYMAGQMPAYYSLPESQRWVVTSVMNAYDTAGDLIDRGFIDEAAFLGSYSWYVQTHWHWTRNYVAEIRRESVGGEMAFSSFERLKNRAAKLQPQIAARLAAMT